MIYMMGVIAFALFIGVCMIDELFVTDEHKWFKYLIIVEKFLLGFVLTQVPRSLPASIGGGSSQYAIPPHG